jgi:hypothetical protein
MKMLIDNASLQRVLWTGMFTLFLAACGGNSEITNEYVSPDLAQLDLEGVLVVGVAQEQDARVNFEEAFTKALSSNGVRALASHTLVPNQKASAEDMIAAAETANLDTILVTRYIGAASEDVYHPGTVYYGVTPAYGGSYNRRFGGYYAHAYEVAYEQPVWTSNVTHTLVSDLYVTADQQHLWQAVSETLQSGSTKQVRNDAIRGLIGNLKKQGLLN